MRRRCEWEAREFIPSWACLLIGSIVGLLTLALLLAVGEAVAQILWGTNCLHRFGPPMGQEEAGISLLLLVSLAAACLSGRFVFFHLRWRAVWKSIPLCSVCGYDLTGNTSGTCPECGERIQQSG